MPRLGWVCILFIFFVSIGSVQARNYHASRIELKDGTVFTDVWFTKDDFYKVIKVDQDGGNKAVSFGDIALILDKKGKDISEDILGKYYSPPEAEVKQPAQTGQPPESSSWAAASFDNPSEEEQPRNIKRWSTRLAVSPNLSIPAGDYYDGITTGIGYGAELSIRLSRDIAIRGMVSRAGIKSGDLVGKRFDSLIVVQDNAGFAAWRYSVAVEYHNWPRYTKGGKLLYTLYSGVGAIRHSASGSLIEYSPNSGNYYLSVPAEPVTKFMVVTGGGIMVALSPNFGVNFGVDMYMVAVGSDYSDDYYNDVATAYNFDFKVGLVLIN